MSLSIHFLHFFSILEWFFRFASSCYCGGYFIECSVLCFWHFEEYEDYGKHQDSNEGDVYIPLHGFLKNELHFASQKMCAKI